MAGCRAREHVQVQADPVTSAPPKPSSSHAELVIPHFEPTAPPSDDDVQVVLSKTRLLVDGAEVMSIPTPADGAASGLGPKFKPVTPLQKAIEAHLARSDAAAVDAAAVVLADGGTPYRVVVDALFTLGQAGVTKYHLLVITNEKTAAMKAAATLPTIVMHAGSTPLRLSLVVEADGASFVTATGVLGTGCTAGASGVTVPRLAGVLDVDGMRRCAQKLKSSAADETFVTIAATSATPYAEIIATMDAVRTDGHVELFPDVMFGAPR